MTGATACAVEACAMAECAAGTCPCARKMVVPDTLEAQTAKIVVAGADLYVTAARHVGALCYVDVTISVRGVNNAGDTERAIGLEQTKGDAVRALLEVVCREANALLAVGAWTEADLISAWAATRFDPAGITMWPGGVGGLATSPLDAVARWLRGDLEKGLTSGPEVG
jgi:hypothetical protein